MRAEPFSVRIVGGREEAGGYVVLNHGQHYEIQVTNHDRNLRADAEVRVDGKPIGTFRLDRRDGSVLGHTLTLQRPPHDHGRFTFYRSGTPEAAKVGESGQPQNGLVEVAFYPERKPEPRPVPTVTLRGHVDYGDIYASTETSGISITKDWAGAPTADAAGAAAPANYSEGMTGLSGHSDQGFYDVAPLERDLARTVTIRLRLVARTERLDEPRPLFARETPTPPPVAVR